MKKRDKGVYVERSQNDYSISFKLNVDSEVQSGEQSTHVICLKYGIQARSTLVN